VDRSVLAGRRVQPVPEHRSPPTVQPFPEVQANPLFPVGRAAPAIRQRLAVRLVRERQAVLRDPRDPQARSVQSAPVDMSNPLESLLGSRSALECSPWERS
jgi:hypothetical protein